MLGGLGKGPCSDGRQLGKVSERQRFSSTRPRPAWDTTRPVKGSPDSRLLVAVVVIHSAMEFSKTGLVWFLGKEEQGPAVPAM